MLGGTALGGVSRCRRTPATARMTSPTTSATAAAAVNARMRRRAFPPGIHSHGLLLAESVDCTAELPYRACRQGPSYGAVVLASRYRFAAPPTREVLGHCPWDV